MSPFFPRSTLSFVSMLTLCACDAVQGLPPHLKAPEVAAPSLSTGQVAPVAPAVTGPAPGSSRSQPESEPSYLSPRVRLAHYEIVKLNYARAAELLTKEVGPSAAVARARLALYRADCEEARAHLSSSLVQNEKNAQELVSLSESCFGATAGSVVVEDKQAGVWVRLQDHADRVLVPMIVEVAARARQAIERDLGGELPRPLRIDLVRDLFSLSAVSGLPVDAAETTGTVAVARWGRVTMVSPRALSNGFPWADTLAHEITHLLISRATLERAPLWLQEGIAKREERRWRKAQLFDDVLDFEQRAYQAQLAGRSVGVDKIGPSIAMLPSADDAATAFAEVTSFMEYWIERNGPESLYMLLRDMEVAKDANSAMMSVSGYGVVEWELLWREAMVKKFQSVQAAQDEGLSDSLGPRALARSLRLVELLTIDGFPQVAEFQGAVDLDRAPHSAALRFLTTRAAMLRKDGDDTLYLGETGDVDQPHAGWLALYAAQQSQSSPEVSPSQLMEQAYGLDPLLPEVACGGVPWVGQTATLDTNLELPFKVDEQLCFAARKLPIRGSR